MERWNPPGNAVSHKLKILLVGPKRTGKSSTGNTLLGRGQVFDTRGGQASTAASAVTAGRHLTVVDAQGWSSCEDFIPEEEKIELLRALSLCGAGGPHVVLLVIPLLDFTEPEKRAVEKRMEVFTSAIWRHTMVLFTLGDWLKGRGRSIEDHIQSGGPALHWLMEKCRYRYHVLDNKAAVTGKQEGLTQGVNGGGRKQAGIQRGKNYKEAARMSRVGESVRRGEGGQEQVREMLRKVEDMLLENGGWHFSLHMYQRLEEEWSCREQQLRAWLEAKTDVGSVGRKQKVEVEAEQKQRLERGEQERSLGKEPKNKEECVERKINIGEAKEERVEVELKWLSSEEDRWDTSSDSGGEREEERRVMTEEEESTEVKAGIIAPCRPNGGQRLAFRPISRLA